MAVTSELFFPFAQSCFSAFSQCHAHTHGRQQGALKWQCLPESPVGTLAVKSEKNKNPPFSSHSLHDERVLAGDNMALLQLPRAANELINLLAGIMQICRYVTVKEISPLTVFQK